MSSVYLALDDADTQSVDFVDHDQYFRLRALGSGPAGSRWESVQFEWGETSSDEYGRPLRRGAVSSFGSDFLALVSDCRATLEPIIGRDGEFLPAELHSREIWIYRSTTYVDAIDLARSHLSSETRLRRGDRMIVDAGLLGDAQAFVLTAKPLLGTFFSESARDRLVATGLFDTIEFRRPSAIEVVD